MIAMTSLGCAGLGGQALYARAGNESNITINFYVTDGGTDLGGLFYRPSGGTLVRGGTTEEATDTPTPEPIPTTLPADKPEADPHATPPGFHNVPVTIE